MIKNMERRTFLEAAIAIVPLAALGQSSTPQTSAQTMKIETLIEQRKLRRKVHGIAAGLLQFAADGQIAVEAFQNHLVVTHHAGLIGLRYTRRKRMAHPCPKPPGSIAGHLAFPFRSDNSRSPCPCSLRSSGETVPLYRREMDVIAGFGGIPILFQTSKKLSGIAYHWEVGEHSRASGEAPITYLIGYPPKFASFIPGVPEGERLWT